MTIHDADRYALRGSDVPAIYHGTLAGVEQVISDAREQSLFNPGVVITVWKIKGKERERIRVFVAGQEQEATTA